MPRSSFVRLLSLGVILFLLSAACALPLQFLAGGASSEGEDDQNTTESTALPGAGEADGPGTDESMAGFSCPNSPEAYELWFDHDVKFDTPGFGSWDVMTSGAIVLSVAQGLSDNTVHMPFQPGEVIVPGTVVANFGRGDQTCNFEGEMEVIVNIDGYCDQAVVHLNVVENWGEVDTSMTCCSAGQDCDTFPFQWMLPVVQYEDLQFNAANGYQVVKPFAGGDGQLTWTLQVPVQPVPIGE